MFTGGACTPVYRFQALGPLNEVQSKLNECLGLLSPVDVAWNWS
jgi:hypothetical protein